ncbi:hypothetical protein [Bacteroides congonensis]|uniref:hypothetical protein n=1 Tax=Bacteroides congonensis TaxID=1871006 RepID=UPI000A59424D|nr:hypothetical protein [Bacteroides congonensis]
MKHVIILLIALVCVTSCSKEDAIDKQTVLENVYTIEDDPNDPVQHKRYQIYQTYQVPVYFNDTISVKEIGTDWYGNPVKRYETLDLNWGFDSYTTSIKYKYDYLQTEEDKLNALNFAEQYLQLCSRSMRPFSIILADNLTSTSTSLVIPDNYYVGLRTLVLFGIADITDPDEIMNTSQAVIGNMLIQKISGNETIVDQFGAVSGKLQAYYKIWGTELDCTDVMSCTRKYGMNVNNLYEEAPYVLFYNKWDKKEYTFMEYVEKYNLATKEEVDADRKLYLQDIGRYGFIRGWSGGGVMSPQNAKEDLGYFVLAIVALGKDRFAERYGASPLVMTKFNILYDYITIDLNVEL